MLLREFVRTGSRTMYPPREILRLRFAPRRMTVPFPRRISLEILFASAGTVDLLADEFFFELVELLAGFIADPAVGVGGFEFAAPAAEA